MSESIFADITVDLRQWPDTFRYTFTKLSAVCPYVCVCKVYCILAGHR